MAYYSPPRGLEAPDWNRGTRQSPVDASRVIRVPSFTIEQRMRLVSRTSGAHCVYL